jgi:hypothetical protein
MHETHAIPFRFVLALDTPRSTECPGAQHIELVARLTSKTVMGLTAFVDLREADASSLLSAPLETGQPIMEPIPFHLLLIRTDPTPSAPDDLLSYG